MVRLVACGVSFTGNNPKTPNLKHLALRREKKKEKYSTGKAAGRGLCGRRQVACQGGWESDIY